MGSIPCELDYAYSTFFCALREALLSKAPLPVRLAGLVSAVSHLEKRQFPDQQIWNRLETFIKETTGLAWADDALGFVLTDEHAADYLEQALSIFSAIAITYGHQKPGD
jgi:hypothetical protein